MKIKYTLAPGAIAPTYATDGSAGMDIYSIGAHEIGDRSVIPVRTGLFVEVPDCYALLILPRSGLSSSGYVVANSPGLIDPDYRGEICVLMRRLYSRGRKWIDAGTRVAQMVLVEMPRIELEKVDSLSATVRGDGGFGSTGD